MKKMFLSKIKWIAYENGGRRMIPPKNTRYSPIMRIDAHTNQDWSIEFICPDFNGTDMINFCFLSEDAPYNKVTCNVWYNVYEGNKKVAEIKIVEIIEGGI